MWTKDTIPAFLSDRAQQESATPEDWAAIREAILTVYADKPVTMSSYRHKLDMLKKEILGTGSTPKAKKITSKATILQKENILSGKTFCRTCGAPLSPTAKSILEHYEKKHYSEFVKNRLVMNAHPLAFVVNK